SVAPKKTPKSQESQPTRRTNVGSLPSGATAPQPEPAPGGPSVLPKAAPPAKVADPWSSLVPEDLCPRAERPAATPTFLPGSAADRCAICGTPLGWGSREGPVDLSNPSYQPVCSACRDSPRDQPQPVPGYQIIRELGRGGMGVVALAIRACDLTVVALKTV